MCAEYQLFASLPLVHCRRAAAGRETGSRPFAPGRQETLYRVRRVFSPQVKPWEILPGLRRTHEKNQSRTAQAETTATMSRFRIFQTPVNQGFFDRPQRAGDTFILYPHKSRFNCVTEANRQEVRTITEYITADTTMTRFLPYPYFLLKMDLSYTARLLYALLLDRSTLSQKNGWQDSEGRTYIVYPVSEITEAMDKGALRVCAFQRAGTVYH